MAKTIADVMTPDLVTCGPDDELHQAAKLMRDQNIGDVVVVDETAVRGIVTDRDLVVRAIAAGLDPATRVREVLSDRVVTVDARAGVETAAEIMRDQAIRRLAVVDGEQLVGIVSIGDLAIEADPKSALAHISAAAPNS